MSTNFHQTGRLSPQAYLQQRYMIIAQVGRGGMGAVYKANDTRFGSRIVAIKEMGQANLNPEELKEATSRFEQEARMLGSLSHPNLPRIYDAFSERGRSYLVMDYIEGKTLLEALRETRSTPLPTHQVLNYARQLCDVLAYLHQQRPPIIFRDVKPTNIMVTGKGHIYLIDFGIARFFKEGKHQDTVLLGSPGYAPPEQHGLAQTTPRSDIYGLGATLHHCLTGRDPYYAQDRFFFPPIQQYNPQVPKDLEQLVLRMVAYHEQQRPASVNEVQQILTTIIQQANEHTVNISPARMTPPPLPPLAPTTPVPLMAQETIIPGILNNHTQPGVAPVVPASGNRAFVLIFSTLMLLTLVSSISVLTMLYPMGYGWAFLLETGLAVLFIGIILFNIERQGHLARLLLSCTGISTLSAGLMSLALGEQDIQNAVAGMLSLNTQSQLLLLSIIITTLLSLGWMLLPISGTQRLLLALLPLIALPGPICLLTGILSAGLTTLSWHLPIVLSLLLVIAHTLMAAHLGGQIQMNRRPSAMNNAQ